MPLLAMPRFVTMLLLVLFISIPSMAQNSNLDSLRDVVKKSSGPSRIDALNTLAFEQTRVDFKLAQKTLKESKALAKELQYSKGVAESDIYLGICEYLGGNTVFARQLFQEGLALAQKEKLHALEGYGTTQMGNLYRNQGRYDSARLWYNRSHAILQDSLHPWQLSVLYRNLALMYRALSSHAAEHQYLMKSKAIRDRLPDKVLKTDILVLLGQFYIAQGDYPKAKTELEEARLVNPDGILPETQRTIDYSTAIILLQENKYREALQLLSAVTTYFLETGNIHAYVKTLIEVADVLDESGSYELSLQQSLEAIDLARKNGFKNEEVHAMTILAGNYLQTAQDSLAMATTQQLLVEARKHGFDEWQAAAENLLGNILHSKGSYNEALIHFNTGLSIRERFNNRKGMAHILTNMGDTYYGGHMYVAARKCIERSMSLEDSIGNIRNKHWNYLRLAKISAAQHQTEQSKRYLQLAEETALQNIQGTSRKLVDFQSGILQVRRDLERVRGNYAGALQFSLKIESLRDSLSAMNFTDRISGMKALLELEKKSQELILKNDEILRQQTEIRRNRLLIAATTIGITLLIILLFITYRYYTKTRGLNKTVQERNEEIMAQSEELTEANIYLTKLNDQLSEKNEEVRSQSDKLEIANRSLTLLNSELAEKTEELAAQSEELTQSNHLITSLNLRLEEKVRSRTKELEQAYKELDTFFYRSSHDFRRPLTTFMGLAEVAKITVADPNALDLFDKVNRTAHALDRMLIKLLSISELTADQQAIKLINIRTYIEEAYAVYSPQILQHNILAEIHPGVYGEIHTCPTFIKNILENLIENAIVFRCHSNPRIMVNAELQGDGMIITVEDNGIGMEAEYIHRATEMFFRGSERSQGNGLGLYIVKKSTEKLNGEVTVQSVPRRGTIVTVRIPV